MDLDQAPFVHVCQLLNALENLWRRKGPVRRRLVQQVSSEWLSRYRSGTLFVAFRLFLPGLDNQRVFYLRERRILQLTLKALELARTPRGRALEERWLEPMASEALNVPILVEQLLTSEALCSDPVFTVLQVDSLLTDIAVLASLDYLGNLDRITSLIRTCYLGMTPMEVKWFLRIILREWPEHVAFDSRLLFEAFHPQMSRVFDVVHDLQACCEAVGELISRGAVDLATSYRPVLGVPVRVMSATRTTDVDNAIHRMAHHSSPGSSDIVYVETKYDGERLQAHMDAKWPQRIRIFTKNGRDCTGRRVGCHQYLQEAVGLGIRCRSAIVEGELLVYNRMTKSVEPFGTIPYLADGRVDVGGSSHLMVMLFDLLHVDGVSWLQRSLRERRLKLAELVSTIPGRVQVAPYTPIGAHDRASLETLFKRSIQPRAEGFVLKRADSLYVPGSRHWLKLKRDFVPGMGDTCDLVVLGCGLNRDHLNSSPAALWNSLVCGCLINEDEVSMDDSARPVFHVLLSVTFGLEDGEWLRLQPELEASVPVHDSALFYDVVFSEHRPNVERWLCRPFLATLRGSGFVQERAFWTLRLPRIQRILLHESWREGMTFRQMQEVAVASEASDGNSKDEHDMAFTQVNPVAFTPTPVVTMGVGSSSISEEVTAVPSAIVRYVHIYERHTLCQRRCQAIEREMFPHLKPLYTWHAVENVEAPCYVVTVSGTNQPSALPVWCELVHV